MFRTSCNFVKHIHDLASFFKDWIAHIGESPATISEGDIKSMEIAWQSSKELGLLKTYPDVRGRVWEHALRGE